MRNNYSDIAFYVFLIVLLITSAFTDGIKCDIKINATTREAAK